MLHPHQKINDPLTTSEARIDGVNVRFSASFCSPSLPLLLLLAEIVPEDGLLHSYASSRARLDGPRYPDPLSPRARWRVAP